MSGRMTIGGALGLILACSVGVFFLYRLESEPLVPPFHRGMDLRSIFELNENPQSQAVLKLVEKMIIRLDAKPDNLEDLAKSFSNSLAWGKKPKVILVYTSFFGDLPWLFLKTSDILNSFVDKAVSPLFHCRLTYNKSELTISDAVVFHGRDLPSVKHMKELIKQKPPSQRWVFFILENPHHTWKPLDKLNGMFNWTMTYRRDSDIFAPYGMYYEDPSNKRTSNRNYAMGKDKLIVWPVSNCGYPREKLALKLSKLIPVHVFGGCRSRFPKHSEGTSCRRFTKECDNLMRRYKFRLSFENRNCKDYITEKYWGPLEQDIVPIVLGGSNYDSNVAVPGSYINVMDFPSLKALADYLNYLDKNDTAYNEYFAWKKKYSARHFESSYTCLLCAALNLQIQPKVYNDLEKFWGIDENCKIHDQKMFNLTNQ